MPYLIVIIPYFLQLSKKEVAYSLPTYLYDTRHISVEVREAKSDRIKRLLPFSRQTYFEAL